MTPWMPPRGDQRSKHHIFATRRHRLGHNSDPGTVCQEGTRSAGVMRTRKHIAILNGGRIAEQGTAEQIMSASPHEYTSALIADTPDFEPARAVGG